MVKFIIDGEEFVGRTYSEMEDWEKQCVMDILLHTPLTFLMWRREAIVAVDVGTKIPKGFAVIGVCSKDTFNSIRFKVGDNTVSIVNILPTKETSTHLLPTPIIAPVRTELIILGDETKPDSNVSVIAVNIIEMLNMFGGQNE
jgi:hypothetical protein